jgi:GNAT superfamily N-acetyltransferase
MNDAENNLWHFYKRIGLQKEYSFQRSESWSVVSAPLGKWPSLIFETDIREGRNFLLEMMVDGIRNNGLPCQFIAGSDLFGPEHQSVLRRNHFSPVDKWTIMEINPGAFDRISDAGNGISVRHINDFSELKEFSAIVNSELFRNLPVDAGLLKTLTESDDFTVYGVFSKGEIVSGLLVFILNNVAGLYMVVTKKGKQRRGFGSRLLIDTINRMKTSGISKIILHSSVLAVPFYRKAGFSVTGEMYIYRYFF